MTSPHRQILPGLEATAPPREPAALSEHLLEEILLRIASAADLARASATCRSFRRIITDPSFHRRYRSLYPPLLLSILCDGSRFQASSSSVQPAAAPHPNAPAARSLANDPGFSFDCLPVPVKCWVRCDVCDGRVLLERFLEHGDDSVFFAELAVCDPVYRLFRLLPPIPEDLVTYVQVQDNSTRYCEAFLVPSGHQEETSFKVIGRSHCKDKLVVFIFSSESNLWSMGTSNSWADLGLSTPPNFSMGCPQYKHGCFYWKLRYRNKSLKLNISRMEFSTVNLPPSNYEQEVVIAEAGEGMLGMFILTMNNAACLRYFTSMKSKGEEANEWLLENTIPFPCNCNIIGALEGYIFLLGDEKAQARMVTVCFSLQIKTLKIERINSINYHYFQVHPYFGYPSFISTSISEFIE
ncbi:hypothetical protein BAE44_0005496 [Dichanthelium oligosanthes]|uniref:F-box domain-containing protein n=1 Tax=Dichanthelium oligosanthes TaxID=888268 RepID=A0A1E5W821_9POAL|nr:hypothetical protein BAE44_0005496 [Dichanthelium oligosanthes]